MTAVGGRSPQQVTYSFLEWMSYPIQNNLADAHVFETIRKKRDLYDDVCFFF